MKPLLHVVREIFFDSTNQHFLYGLISFGNEIDITRFCDNSFLLVEGFFDNLIYWPIIGTKIGIANEKMKF